MWDGVGACWILGYGNTQPWLPCPLLSRLESAHDSVQSHLYHWRVNWWLWLPNHGLSLALGLVLALFPIPVSAHHFLDAGLRVMVMITTW